MTRGFDTKPITDACDERIKLWVGAGDPWKREWGEAHGTPICECGHSLWTHDISRVKAPLDDCAGFKLTEVEVREWRNIKLPIPPS